MNTPIRTLIAPSASRANRAAGAIFFSVFGGAWLVLWANDEFGGSIAAISIVVVVAGAVLWYSYRTYKTNSPALQSVKNLDETKRKDRLFHLVNAGQWIVIFVVAGLLSMSGRGNLILPAVIFIIGLHFIPLARLFQYVPHYITGAALMLLALVYPIATPAGPESNVGALGAGLILLLSASWASFPHAAASKEDGRFQA